VTNRDHVVNARGIIIVAALLAAAGVALGAFGAHGLDKQLQRLGRTANLEQRLAWFETGVRYHLVHALALVAVAALSGRLADGWQQAAAIAFVLGIVLFSGSLYAMTLGPDTWKRLGMITPIGGLALIVGWICVAVGAWRAP
jgi:uncharacterized membrane protein YgdD (TMEM256/DUF423 family)